MKNPGIIRRGMSQPAHALSRDGTRIAYWRTGKGGPLVLVHGTTADHTRWDPLRPHLEPQHEVCAMDRRGRGESGDTAPYDVEREYEDVAAVVDALAAETGAPVDLFGHSFGALCAMEGALRTRNLRRLVLFEPLVFPVEHAQGFAERADALLAEGRREDVVGLFFRMLLGMSDEELERYRAHPSWAVRVAAAHTLPREDRAEAAYRFDPARLRDLDTPTLLLLGGRSERFFRESTEAVAGALPDARIATMANENHFAAVTSPALVARLMDLFLLDGAPSA